MLIRCTGVRENGYDCNHKKEIPDSASTYEKGGLERVRNYCPRCEKDMEFIVEVGRSRRTK